METNTKQPNAITPTTAAATAKLPAAIASKTN